MVMDEYYFDTGLIKATKSDYPTLGKYWQCYLRKLCERKENLLQENPPSNRKLQIPHAGNQEQGRSHLYPSRTKKGLPGSQTNICTSIQYLGGDYEEESPLQSLTPRIFPVPLTSRWSVRNRSFSQHTP